MFSQKCFLLDIKIPLLSAKLLKELGISRDLILSLQEGEYLSLPV